MGLPLRLLPPLCLLLFFHLLPHLLPLLFSHPLESHLHLLARPQCLHPIVALESNLRHPHQLLLHHQFRQNHSLLLALLYHLYHHLLGSQDCFPPLHFHLHLEGQLLNRLVVPLLKPLSHLLYMFLIFPLL